jgi:hypothetical protein
MKSMTHNNSQKIYMTDECHQIDVNLFVADLRRELQLQLVASRKDLFLSQINFTYSVTGNGGERIWFECPRCFLRCGVLYRHPVSGVIACRLCLHLKHRKVPYKGMLDAPLRSDISPLG